MPSDSNSYPTMGDSDRQHLVEADEDHAQRLGLPCLGGLLRHKRFLIFLTVLALIVTGHVIAIYYIYYRCVEPNCIKIKVLALNSWGMPESLGSQYKSERMDAIAKEIAKGHHDLYLLVELWMENDHALLANHIHPDYRMTGFRELALGTCDGRISPIACSGLAIVSRFPFEEIEFNSFTDHGNVINSVYDGEWLARKGVGRVRIRPIANHSTTVDVFVTHTAADPDPRYHNYTNEFYRNSQIKELMHSYVKQSTADAIILGGDFNAGPDFGLDTPYQTIREFMSNCMAEIYYSLQDWFDIRLATYGNPKNTFSGNIFSPVIYDHLFYRTNSKVYAYTSLFDVPLFKLKMSTLLNEMTLIENDTDPLTNPIIDGSNTKYGDHKSISYSDHEAITAEIYITTKD